MLATGGRILAAIEKLQRWGCRDIRVLCLIAARPGLERVTAAHPAIPIYTCAIDPQLNERNFIVPGLGDAGDRQFHT
jgi:uracil phosphoribosyltransferase